MYFNLQNVQFNRGSTIDYRWRVQCFPQDLNRLLPFNPLDCFTIHFKTILIRFLCVSGFQSPVYPALVRILHWLTARLKRLNDERGHTYIKQFGVACSAICSTNHFTAIKSVARISIILRARNCLVVFWEGDLSLSKVHKGPLGYAEGSPLTLRNHFIQPYRALDTLFSKYY